MTEASEPSERVTRILREALDLAAHPDTPQHERDAATARAQSLMEKYALSEAMARAANQVLSGCVTEYMEFTGVFGVQHRDIAAVVVQANDGFPVVSNEKRFVEKKSGKFGYDHVQVLHMNLHSGDVDRVKSLIASLSLQSQNALSQFDRTNSAKGHQRYLDRRTFLQGFRFGLEHRLQEAKNRARKEAEADHAQATGGTFAQAQNAFALAIRHKDDELEKHMKDRYGNDGLRSSRRRRNKMGSDDAAAEGVSAGRNASTGEASITPARKELE